MSERSMSPESRVLRRLLVENRGLVEDALRRYGAVRPRLFGSVVRGTADGGSDIDILVDLDLADGNTLLRASGLSEELSRLLPHRVDVVTAELLRPDVRHMALSEAESLWGDG